MTRYQHQHRDNVDMGMQIAAGPSILGCELLCALYARECGGVDINVSMLLQPPLSSPQMQDWGC